MAIPANSADSMNDDAKDSAVRLKGAKMNCIGIIRIGQANNNRQA